MAGKIHTILKQYDQHPKQHHLIGLGLQLLAVTHPDYALLLRHRYIDQLPHGILSNANNLSEARLYDRLASAATRLDIIINNLDTPYYHTLSKLPRPNLVGIETHSKQLAKAIGRTDHFLVVTGLSGSGKTALIQHTLHHIDLIRYFDRLIYIDLKKQNLRLNDLTELRKWNTLIVIDQVDLPIAKMIQELAYATLNPSKLIFISQQWLPGIHRWVMPELSKDDALSLLESLINTHQGQISPTDPGKIYRHVGGHPAALHYLAERAYLISTDMALAELEQPTHPLYQRVYNLSLSPMAKAVLFALSHFDGTADLEALKYAVGLAQNDFLDTIYELVHQSLIRVSGTLSERLYQLDPLTRSYLRTM
ncbi:MAG: hypothetical protein AAF629_32785 [Chloroflexota bacterium]